MADQIHHATGVPVFVVVPRHQLNEVVVEGNPGSCVEDTAVSVTYR